jgi:phenylalanyl-tRNA synthetase alpha chain
VPSTIKLGDDPLQIGLGGEGGQGYHENDLFQVIRDVTGDLVEKVQLIDEYVQEGKGQTGLSYRVTYRAHDRSLTNEAVDGLQEQVRRSVEAKLDIALR